MSFQNQSIKFQSEAVPDNTLYVKSLSGTEKMSGLFEFGLELVSTDPDIDIGAVLYAPAKVGLLQHLGGDLKTFKYWSGCLSEFEQLARGQDWIAYRATLVPDMWKLSEFYRSRIFMDRTIAELVADVLENEVALKSNSDFEWKLSRPHEGDEEGRDTYPKHEYVVQYEESDLNLVQRWLEHEGIYYYFDNDGTTEKVRFGDTRGGYKPTNPAGSNYPYRPQSAGAEGGGGDSTQGEDGEHQLEEILEFTRTSSRQPKSVTLNDYNWRDPAVRLSATQDVNPDGVGIQNEYNDHYKTPGQGKSLAEVRAQEWTCRADVYTGISTCRAFRPGRTFTLEEHYRADYNSDYVLIEVRHAAEQGLNLETGMVSGAHYQNRFVAIPAELDFRPERTAVWPTIHGVINARIDGAGDGTAAELDEKGRYKVKIPFDQYMDEAGDGEASRFIRMAQPYSGVDSGFHFPLLKGTEVLITHIDGDPDRPIISGSVPNPETVSPVDSSNASQNRIQTTSGNMMLMDDDGDATGFLMVSGSGDFIQDFRVANGGTTGQGTGIGGAQVPGGRARTTIERVDTPAGSSNAAASEPQVAATADQAAPETPGGDPGLTPRAIPRRKPLPIPPQAYANMPAMFREKLFGIGQAGAVEGKQTSLAATQSHSTAGGVLSAGSGKIGSKGGNFDGDYYLDSQVFPKKLEFRIGDLVKISQNTNLFNYADVSNDYSWGTGGIGFHQEDGDTDEESWQFGNSSNLNYQVGTTHTENYFMGYQEKIDIGLDWTNAFEMTVGSGVSLAIKGDVSTDTEIKVGFYNENKLELSFKATSEIIAGGSSALKVNAAAEIEFIAAAATTKVYLSAKKDDIELTWKNWMGLKKDKTLLQETKTNLQETKTNLQKTDTQVQSTDTQVQSTETQVQQTATQVQSTETQVQQTATQVQSTDTQVQSTDTILQSVTTALNETTTTALDTNTSAAHFTQ